MKEHESPRLPLITLDNMPLTVEQQTLNAVLRIETLLTGIAASMTRWVHDEAVTTRVPLEELITKIEPTETPFAKHHGKKPRR